MESLANSANDLPNHVSAADKYVTFESDGSDEIHAPAALVLDPSVAEITIDKCHKCTSSITTHNGFTGTEYKVLAAKARNIVDFMTSVTLF